MCQVLHTELQIVFDNRGHEFSVHMDQLNTRSICLDIGSWEDYKNFIHGISSSAEDHFYGELTVDLIPQGSEIIRIDVDDINKKVKFIYKLDELHFLVIGELI